MVTGSNRRPTGCKPVALPAELTTPIEKTSCFGEKRIPKLALGRNKEAEELRDNILNKSSLSSDFSSAALKKESDYLFT